MKRKTVLKRTLACCLAVILMLTGVPLASFSGIDPANFKDFFGFKASAATWENLGCVVLDGEATITGCDNSISGDIVIPDTIGGYPVTSIGQRAFFDCTGLTSITIPDSVTSIGGAAFKGCTGLTSITIPDRVTCIGDWAFSCCTGLTSITIPDSVTSIGSDAFAGCTGLTSITIPDSVTSIGYSAFSCCTGLTKITVSSGNTVYHSTDNCLIETETKTLISGCKNSMIPTDGSVTSIGRDAFRGCTGLTSITIPDSVTSIGKYAFSYCTGLTSVTISDGVTSIGNWAFSGCTGLTSVTIPDSVMSIGISPFIDCSGLTKITVSSGNTVYHSTDNCLIRTKTKTLISGCKNSMIPTDGSVTSIGEDAFYGCTGLTSITIPDSVTSIGDSAFSHCTGLTSITIPDSVTSIGESAFYWCTGLTSITIPDGVTSIGESAFYGCTGLTDVYYTGSEADWKKISIGYYNSPLTSSTIHYNQTGSSVDNKVYNDVLVKNFEIEKTSGKTNLSFNPSWFTQDSLNYNHNLAKLTSQFAMLGYAKKADLENALKAIGFIWDENFVDLNTGSKKPGENDTEESKKRVNYFIAHKKMTVNGEETTLVFMGLIGSSHNQWYSNFDPGTGVVHKGFNNAKNFITNSSKTGRLDEYFKKYLQGEKNVKILIAGHSRGAATSNLVAAELIDTGRYTSPENVYTYAYATPNSTSNPDRGASRYNRIFNFVNPEDFVTKCMPSKWHYGRYGITYTLPSKTNESSKSYKKYYNNMNSRFKDYFGNKSYQPYKEGEKPVYEVVKKLTTTVGTVNEMYSTKMFSGTGKKNTAEFFRDALCPFVAKNGKDEENAATINMLAAWFSPTTSKTFDTIADFFLKYEGATSVKKMLDDNGISINFATVSAPALVVALSLVLPKGILPATAIASPWVIYKAEQLLLWARNGQNNFSHAHMAQTYAAFVDSMTEEQIKKTRKSYLNTVNCPVDIEVYEKSTGELVGKITNNVIDETVAAKENAIVMGVDGDSKSFWLPSNEDYEVKLIGNDEGTMDYTVANVDSDLGETERVNFFDVEITDGLTMTGEMKTDTALEDYSLEYDNGNKMTPAETLSGDEITSYNINVSVEGNGYATESMTALSGDYVTVNAMETVGNSTDGWYIFDGWYEDEEKVSSERSFSFVAKGNRSLTAKFVWSDVCLHPLQEELIEIPATCTESGNEPGVFCMMCETYLSGGKEIPALGHDIVTDIEAVKPTCTENGRTLGGNCSRCEYCLESEVVPATGHAEETIPAVAPTCNELGYTAGTKCSVCGEILVKQEEIPALGHDLVIDVEAKEATCSQSGTTEGVHCTRCDYKVEAVEIKPLGHTDEDNDGKCDRCGENTGEPAPSNPSHNCSCACHKKGIANFFFKIILFFQKIFKKNRVCNCGVWHY